LKKDKVKLIFIRFLNEIKTDTYKIIGFEIPETEKERIFPMMLQAMVDFTIPKSYCNLYY